MKQKLTFLTLFLFAVSIVSYSQSFTSILDTMRGRKYVEIEEAIEQFYNQNPDAPGKKQAARLLYKYSGRLDAEGYVLDYANNNWEEYHKNQKSTRKLKASAPDFSGNWVSLDASKYDLLGGGYSGGVGRVNKVVVDPDNTDIIYVATPGGGVWRSLDAGNSWNSISDGMPNLAVSGIAIDPSSPVNNRTIYILTGDGDGFEDNFIGVFKSVDNGATWYNTNLEGGSFNMSYALEMHPTNYNILFAATSWGIQKTTDGGLTWRNTAENLVSITDFFKDVEFNAGNPNIMYATTRFGRYFRSTDAGESWTQIRNGLPTYHTYEKATKIGVTPDDPNYVYLVYGGYSDTVNNVYEYGKFAGLYLSKDGGLTFNLQSNSPNILGGSSTGSDNRDQSWYDLAIVVSPTNKAEVHVGGINMFKSTDEGQTWVNTAHWIYSSSDPLNYTHADIHDLKFFGGAMYCGSDGGIFYSNNHGDDWIDITEGLDITELYRIGASATNEEIVLGGAQDNGSNRIMNNTLSQWAGGDGMECFVDPYSDQIFYGSSQYGGLRKSINGGQSTQYIKPSGAGNGNWVTPFVMDPSDNNTLYAGFANVYKSTNAGSSWEIISDATTAPDRKAMHIAVAPSDPNTIFFSKYEHLFKSIDGGNTWTDVSAGLPNYPRVEYMAISNTDKDLLWACINSDVYKSTDGGNTWTDISANLPNIKTNCIVYQNGSNNRVYVGQDVDVYYIDDDHTEWVKFSSGLAKFKISELEIHYGSKKIRAATYGRGLWESDLFVDDDCNDPDVIYVPEGTAPALKSATTPATPVTIEAESFTETGGTVNDAVWGGPGYGVNRGATTINWVNNNDWVEYPIPAGITGGTYRVEYNISTPSDNAAIALSIDGTPLIEDVVPNNGQWDAYSYLVASENITIDATNTTIRLTASGTNAWQWNLESFRLTQIGDVDVTGVTVTPETASLLVGETVTLTETVLPGDATDKTVTWSSSNNAVATVGATGIVTAQAEGTATITVTTNDGGYTANCQVDVSEDIIDVTGVTVNPTSGTIVIGNTLQLSETVLPGNATDKTVTWSSGNGAIATVDGTGLVTAQAEGTATITVTTNDGGFTATCSVEVITDIANDPVTIEAESFTLTGGTLDDAVWGGPGYGVNRGATTINWVNNNDWVEYPIPAAITSGTYKVEYNISTPSDNAAISLSIDGNQLLEDVVPNNGQWDAYSYLEASGNITIDATSSVIRLTASGTNSWQWNLESFRLTKLGGEGVTGVTVTPVTASIVIGETVTLSENVLPTNATDKSVTWSSSNNAIASVSPAGVVTGNAEGTATITVTTNDGGYTANCQVDVSDDIIDVTGITLLPADTNLTVGQTVQLVETVLPENATDKSVIWSSTNNTIATVSTSGLVTAQSVGNAVISVITNDGNFTANANITVEPTIIPVTGVTVVPGSQTIYVGETLQLAETVLPGNATDKTVTWSSNNGSVASVSTSGLVSALAVGNANITVTTNDGGFTATSNITVSIVDNSIVTVEAEDFVGTGGTYNGFEIYTLGDITATNMNQTGDWGEYTVDIIESGKYQLEYFVGTTVTGAALELSIDNVTYLTDAIPNNGNWDDFNPVLAGKYLDMQAGSYTFKLEGAGTHGWEWNMDKFVLTRLEESCYTTVSLKSGSDDLMGTFAGSLPGVVQSVDEDIADNSFISEEVFNIYPNPATSEFTIEFTVNSNEPVSIQLMNIVGELQETYMNNEVYVPGTYEVRYNVENLQGGVYLLKYTNGADYSVQRLVIK